MKSQKKEIIWNLVNSFLAGALVFLGAFTTGDITTESLCIAFITFCIVFLTKFKNYWDGEQGEYSNKAFSFINY